MSNTKTQEPVALARRALSIEETAKTCGVSRATLYRLISDGRLPTVKILGRRLVRPEAIDALLKEGA
jgi:excisionase family DNA binding protein